MTLTNSLDPDTAPVIMETYQGAKLLTVIIHVYLTGDTLQTLCIEIFFISIFEEEKHRTNSLCMQKGMPRKQVTMVRQAPLNP